MIREYFQSLSANTGTPPPPPLVYNPVCVTMATQTVGVQAFFKCTATYTVGQNTTVTIVVNTAYNGGLNTRSYTITRTILNGQTVSGNSKLLYTSGYGDEYFTGIGSMSFSPAADAGGKTFKNNGLC